MENNAPLKASADPVSELKVNVPTSTNGFRVSKHDVTFQKYVVSSIISIYAFDYMIGYSTTIGDARWREMNEF